MSAVRTVDGTSGRVVACPKCHALVARNLLAAHTKAAHRARKGSS